MIIATIKENRVALAIVTVLSIVAGGGSMLLLAHVNRVAVEGVTPGALQALWKGLGLVLLIFVAQCGSQLVTARLGPTLVARLRADLARRFLSMDYERLMSSKHQVTGVLVEDVERIAPLVLLGPQFLLNGLIVVACFCYLAYLTPQLLLIFTIFVMLSASLLVLVVKKAHSSFESMRQVEEELFEQFRTIAEAKKELTLNTARAEHFSQVLLATALKGAQRSNTKAHQWWGVGQSWSNAVIYCAVFMVVYLGHALLAQSPATILQFIVGGLFVMGPINFLVSAGSTIGIGLSSLNHLKAMDLLSSGRHKELHKLQSLQSPRPDLSGWRTIRVKQLRYDYPQQEGEGFAFGPVDLEIRRGEVMFLVGGNGSGKSTFALLLCALLTPSGGTIEIDGVPVTQELAPQYRALFTGVFLDFYLFRHIIDRRGALASPDVVSAWLEKLGLRQKITLREGQLSTVDLSQGQRKRLALMQSCIDDTDIFILDEWAADQDARFRQYFYEEILPELRQRGKTLLVITHDERYFAVADRIVRLDQGQILADARSAREPEMAG